MTRKLKKTAFLTDLPLVEEKGNDRIMDFFKKTQFSIFLLHFWDFYFDKRIARNQILPNEPSFCNRDVS